MRTLLLVFSLCILSLYTTGCSDDSQGTKVDFFVSPLGDDTNPGTFKKPFATLARARDAVREKIAEGMTDNITVLIRTGEYYLSEPVVFGPKDSGTKEYSVTYAVYPGEKASFMGGVKLSGWEPYKDAIMQTAIPHGVIPNQIFDNGVRMERARHPQKGYFTLEKTVEGKMTSEFIYREDDLNPEGWDVTDAFVYIWPGHNWFTYTKAVASIDPKTRRIALGSNEGYDMRPGNRYYILNVLELLNTPGECQISPSKGKIYVWPREGTVDTRTIVASCAKNIITIAGSATDSIVRNIHFEGLDFSIAKDDIITVTNAEDCSVRYCLIENGGMHGVLINGHAQRITVYGCLIRYNGANGVEIAGLAPGKPDVNHHNVIENNHIHHCGRLVGHGYGVSVSQSGYNKVINNHIHHMPRYAATIKGMYFKDLMKQIPEATRDNRYDYLYSHDNLYAFNHIHHVNEDSQDTGAIESWCPGRNNTFDHYIIHDVGNDMFDLESGIYLDDGVDYFTVTNNIIWGVRGTSRNQAVFAKGIDNRIENNIFILNETNWAAITSLEMAGFRTDSHEYIRNIIYFESGDGAVYDFYNWSDERVAVSDSSIIWKPQGKLTIKGGPADGDFDKWRAILGKKFEQRSILADPMFVDHAARNYRLKPESPARKLGFKDIDTSRIGLKDDFPERFERD